MSFPHVFSGNPVGVALHYPYGNNFFIVSMFVLSATIRCPLPLFFLAGLPVKRCLIPALPIFTLPLAVNLNLFAAPRCVFNFIFAICFLRYKKNYFGIITITKLRPS